MANATEYAEWLVKNEAKKGTPEFETVAEAYREAKAEEGIQAGQYTSVLGETKDASVPRKLTQSMMKGVTGLGDIFLGAPENVKRLYQYATTPDMPIPRAASPSRTFLTEKNIITPEAEFKSPVGRVAGFTTELMTSGGLNPFSMTKAVATKPLLPASREIGSQVGRTAFQGAVGGSTSELLNSIGVESPVAQFLATGGAMTAAGLPVGGLRSTPADIVNRNIKGVTPEQLRLAQQLQKNSVNIGMPITGAEAIAQVSGQRGLTTTQRFLEQAEPSQGTMNQFMAGRPAGVQQGFGNLMQQVSPNTPTSATPFNLQQAGQNVIRGAESSVTGNVSPYFMQAGKQAVPNTDIAGMMTNPKIADAVEHVRSTGTYGVKNEPANSVKTLIAAKQYLDDQYSKQMNAVTGAEKNAARVTYSANRQLDDYLNTVSPDYAKGSQKFEVAQKTQMTPLKQGVIGQIAEGATGADVLMPQKPVSLYPADIKRTADLLRRKDPNALPEWTRQNLEGIFNETTQNLATGQNQFGGPKFAAAIAGNKQQRDNLRTLVTETSGMQAWQGFERFLDVAQAQGQRMPANSATAFNEMIKGELGSGIVSKGLTVFKPSNIVNWAENVQLGRNADMLAKMLTDPDSVNKLQELARTGPRSAKAQTLVNSIAGGYIAQKPEITEESK
jgi:hypothetical protein